MKERMEGMSPKEFMEMMAAISDKEDEMGKAATLRKDLLRAALGSTNPAFKRRVAHILMAADDKVQVRRKDTGRLVWVTKEKANDPDYEMTEEKGDAKEAPKKDNLKKDKDAPKAERLKGKPGEKAEGKGDSSEKDPDKKDKSKTPKRPDSMAGLDLLEGHDSKEFSALMSDMTATPEETQEVIDDLESALKYDMEDDEEEEIRQIKRTIKELKRYQDEYKEQKGKKAMTLRKDLIRLASTMKPSPERSALIQVLASHNKSAHFPYLDRRSGNLSREGIRGDGLSKSVMRGGDGFALYYVDAAKNHSKFYEGMLHEQPNGLYDVKFRWGAMTDSGYTGRVDGRKYDEKFSNLTYSEAKRALDKKKRAKVGKGYVDTFGPKHKDPVTGKKLKQGEYPIGLAREVGFGWGTQTMAYCVPALREIAEHISRALDPNDGTTAEADLSRAQRLVSNVPDSQMAGKINRYIAVVMREVNRGSDQAVINKKLRTLQNYIQKQVALCG
jgi:predicted DNA-binding WGR domain protein